MRLNIDDSEGGVIHAEYLDSVYNQGVVGALVCVSVITVKAATTKRSSYGCMQLIMLLH